MNPILIILILLAGLLLWLLCSFLFIPIGKISNKLSNDAKEAMFKDDEIKEEKE